MSARAAGGVLALALAGALGLAIAHGDVLGRDGAAATAGPDPSARPAFAETRWPFLRDQWGPGRAYRCPAALCAGAVDVFVRPKSGFCNCYSGVEDDDEIDRIGDVDLHSPRFVPLAPGRPASVGAMTGRRRTFRIDTGAAQRQVVAIVVASACNALVATVVSERDLPPAVERAVLDLLDGAPVQRFIAAASVAP
jgi:hypothetical protein